MGIPAVSMLLMGILPSALKVAIYRARGARIGKNVRIGPLSIVIADDLVIGDDVRIGMLSFVRARSVRIGNRAAIGSAVAIDTGKFELGHDSNIMEQVVVGGMRTPRSMLRIGSRVKIFPFCFINPTEPILIEDDVGVGGATYIFTHGSWQSILEGFPIAFGPVTIRRGVWLPWRVFILPNVEIGEYATLGAGALVSRSIAARTLAVGHARQERFRPWRASENPRRRRKKRDSARDLPGVSRIARVRRQHGEGFADRGRSCRISGKRQTGSDYKNAGFRPDTDATRASGRGIARKPESDSRRFLRASEQGGCFVVRPGTGTGLERQRSLLS